MFHLKKNRKIIKLIFDHRGCIIHVYVYDHFMTRFRFWYEEIQIMYDAFARD